MFSKGHGQMHAVLGCETLDRNATTFGLSISHPARARGQPRRYQALALAVTLANHTP